MKHLLRIIPLLFVALLLGACTDDAELNGEEVPFERMDQDTLEVAPGRAFEDTVVVDTTVVDTAAVDTMP